jgi:glycosyltransferase involved in cell wall biosynthesis
MNSLISIIIPAHNAAVFLPDALESVRIQGYSPVEIIVVDDSSHDDTATVAERLGADQVIRRDGQGSPAASRNAGFAVSSGEWLLFLDADDTLPPGTLVAYASHIAAHPDTEIVGGYVHMVTLGGADSSAMHAPIMQRNIPFVNVHLGAALIHRRVIERVGLFDEGLITAEDVDWVLRAEEADVRRVLLRRSTLFYRRHNANLTETQGVPMLKNDFRIALHRAFERRGVWVDETHFPQWSHLLVPITDPPARLSLIIAPPTYTAPDEVLDEITRQTRLPDEVIILAPEDACAHAVIPDALRGRVRFIACALCDASALLDGVRAASGDVIAFLRPGDRWLPEYLQQIVQQIDLHPEVEYIIASQIVVSENLTGTGSSVQPPSLLSALVARRRLFDVLGGFEARFTWAYADHWFMRALDAAVPYRRLESPLVLVRAVPDADVPLYMRELLLIRAESMRRRAHERKYLT